MKLAYEAFMGNVKVGRIINYAIYKTLVQRQQMAACNLSKFLTEEYSIQNSLFLKASGKTKELPRETKK